MRFSLLFKRYSFLIGLTLFIIVVFKTNLNGIIHNLREANWAYLFPAILIILPMFVSKALGWNYIKKKQGMIYRFKDSFLMYGAGQYVGLFTPGRLGEIAKSWYLKKDGHSLGKSLTSTIIDRLTDLLFLIFFATLGSLFFLGIIKEQILLSLFGLVFLGLLCALALKVGLVKWGVKKAFNFLVPEKNKKSWMLNFQDFWRGLQELDFKNYLVIFSITAVSWLLYYWQMYLLARALNIQAPFVYLAVSVTVAGLITLIPISISGIGTREIALIVLLSPLGIAQEKIIAFSFLILFAFLLAALFGLICWFLRPLKI